MGGVDRPAPDSVSEAALLTNLLAPRYTVVSELGQGSASVVYLAEDRKHLRSVAIKVLRPEIAQAIGPERFLREIRIAAALNHPGIVPVFDSGQAGGRLFYVMTFLDGGSLRARLDRDGPLPLSDAIEIVSQVANALQHAHGQQIIHRDLKPDNILLSRTGAVVTDFGIARAVEQAGAEGLTEPGLAVGTPYYMSPEQAAADPRIDARSDVYSLGVVAYEMLTGEPPFRSASPRAVLARKMTDEIPPILSVRDTVPAAVEAAVMRALARVPADRYASAEEFAAALAEAHAVAAPAPALQGKYGKSFVLALLAFVIFGTVGWLGLRGGTARESAPGGEGAPLSLVVLPVRNRSADATQEYIVDGLTDGLTSELGRLRALHVTSRTSAMRYGTSGGRAPDIAAELGVEAIVEGFASVAADSVHVILSLVDASADRQLWSGRFDAPLSHVLVVQRQAAAAIAAALGVVLYPEEKARAALARPVDVEAQRLWLIGNRDLGEADFARALDMYSRATEVDSTFAAAWAGMAIVYAQLGSWWGSMPPDSAYPLAMQAARRAIRLDSTNAEAYVALANALRLHERDWKGADSAFRRGMELVPSNMFARIEYANHLTSMRRFSESIALSEETLRLEPTMPTAYNELAFAMDLAGDDDAIEVYRQSLDVDSLHEQTRAGMAMYFARRDRADSALVHLAAWRRHFDASSPSNIGLAAGMYAAIGDREAALGLMDLLRSHAASGGFVPPSTWAMPLACLGQVDEALNWLERAAGQRDPSLLWLNDRGDPCFKRLHGHPRFEAVFRSMRFPEN